VRSNRAGGICILTHRPFPAMLVATPNATLRAAYSPSPGVLSSLSMRSLLLERWYLGEAVHDLAAPEAAQLELSQML
jgi:hypothetical protein